MKSIARDSLKVSGHMQFGAKKLLDTGFFHIVGAGMVNKVLSFAMSMVLVRVLSKQDYGCYAYAFNIASIFVMFNGLGMTSAIIQVCSELHEDKARSDAVYAFCRNCGLASDVAIGAGMAAVALLVPLAVEGSNGILLLYCAYPFLALLCELRLSYLRVQLENKRYAFMTNVQTFLNLALSIAGAILSGVAGLVVGQSLACAAAWVVMRFATPEDLEGEAGRVSRVQRRDVWSLSLVSSLNNALSQALTLVGTFMVGVFLADADVVAEFKVATAIPFALLFLPGMVITYAYPYFARNKDNRAWTLRNYGRLTVSGFALMGTIAVVFGLLAEPVLILIFGEQYSTAAASFRILLIGFFLTAAFRQPAGNLLVTQRKLSFNTFVGVISIVFNIGFSVALIPEYGMEGGAAAYSATMALGAILNVAYYLRTIRKMPA